MVEHHRMLCLRCSASGPQILSHGHNLLAPALWPHRDAAHTVRYSVDGVASVAVAVVTLAGQWTAGSSRTMTLSQPWQSTGRLTVVVAG